MYYLVSNAGVNLTNGIAKAFLIYDLQILATGSKGCQTPTSIECILHEQSGSLGSLSFKEIICILFKVSVIHIGFLKSFLFYFTLYFDSLIHLEFIRLL